VSDPYGVVQTTISVTRGRITNVSITAPKDNSVSSNINSQAIGYLRSETLNAQSANISAISGATATSQAYVQSLQAALAQVPKSASPSQSNGRSASGAGHAQPGSSSTPTSPPAKAGTGSLPRFAIKGGANDDSGVDDGGSVHVVKPATVKTATTQTNTSIKPPHFAIKGGSDDGSGDGGSSTKTQKPAGQGAAPTQLPSKHAQRPNSDS
jgi:uncharacterized protein with FMN-binding domain